MVNLDEELSTTNDDKGQGTSIEDFALLNQYSRKNQPLFNFLDNLRIQRALESLKKKLKTGNIHKDLLNEYEVKILGEMAQDGIVCALDRDQVQARTRIREKDLLKMQATFRPYDAYNPLFVRVEAERKIHQIEQDSRSSKDNPGGLFIGLVRDSIVTTEIRQHQTIRAGAAAGVEVDKKGILPWKHD